MIRICFLAKTDLTTDGRILNQLKILKEEFGSKVYIDFILLPDKDIEAPQSNIDNFHIISPRIRHNRYFRILTVIDFTQSCLKKLFTIRPNVIHAEDLHTVFPVLIYKLLLGNKVQIIYDDHELPNENEPLYYKIMQFFETRLMKVADYVLFASEERERVVLMQLPIKKSNYLLNLPYRNKRYSQEVLKPPYDKIYDGLVSFKEIGVRLVLHQGSLEEERGRKKLADFSRLNFEGVKIVIMGVTTEVYNSFIIEYKLDRTNFAFVGKIPYEILGLFWNLMDAAIIMYLPTYINNRLCAPNRYFLALNYGIVTIVNEDNPVLLKFTQEFKSGFFIEKLTSNFQMEEVFHYKYEAQILKRLKDKEIKKFVSIYRDLLSNNCV